MKMTKFVALTVALLGLIAVSSVVGDASTDKYGLKKRALAGELKLGTEEWGKAVADHHGVAHNSDEWKAKEFYERTIYGAHKAKESWEKSDVDGDGLLSAQEYMDGRMKRHDPEHAQKMLGKIDKNGDAKMSLMEFFTYMNFPHSEL